MRRLVSCFLVMFLWPAVLLAQANVDGGAAPPGGTAPGNAADPAAGSGTGETAAARAARLAAIAAAKAAAADDGGGGAATSASAAGEDSGGEKTASMPAGPAGGIPFTAETEAAYQQAWQAYYAYRSDGYIHRQRVFEWQDLSTKITFAVVILLVLAGIYFAGVQFHVGMREGRETGEPGEVEMSVKGIKVRSPVLGVIVLTISLAFFYLYLVYVYPIENVF